MQKILFTVFATMTLSLAAFAQDNGECTGGLCGTPEQSGGGCGCGCGCSILIAFTDQGDTYQYADDFDDDGIEDDFDNCPFAFNPTQLDGDGDVRGDDCDNCPQAANFDLADSDADSMGDACDGDADGDLIENLADNCILVPNPALEDLDTDGIGNACDINDDGDNCDDAIDNCPLRFEGQCDGARSLDAVCFPDQDRDNLEDVFDNCIAMPNADQGDGDADGVGDACDNDRDNDGVDNTFDNCANLPNQAQGDVDQDFLGDACDDRLCYVITDSQSCLDPADPFAVHAGRARAVETGNGVEMPVFANRFDTPVKYTWTVVDQPADGDYSIENPVGSVSFSGQSPQYRFEDDKRAMFSARVPGDYVLELRGELVWPDADYPDAKANTSRVTVSVTGEALPSFACGAMPGSSAAAGVLFGLLAVIRRRRR
ncbi:MAG: hypothetical protein A2138_02965 [Deltaproteobacteria bacterium RBG_16_71_12]|nr:MAG: hypothetical protein A2138_02965 [Deltaproteobacteria bacterium RBG_16_71_12]